MSEGVAQLTPERFEELLAAARELRAVRSSLAKELRPGIDAAEQQLRDQMRALPRAGLAEVHGESESLDELIRLFLAEKTGANGSESAPADADPFQTNLTAWVLARQSKREQMQRERVHLRSYDAFATDRGVPVPRVSAEEQALPFDWGQLSMEDIRTNRCDVRSFLVQYFPREALSQVLLEVFRRSLAPASGGTVVEAGS